MLLSTAVLTGTLGLPCNPGRMLGQANSTSPGSHPYPLSPCKLCLVIHLLWGFLHGSLPQLSTILLPLPQPLTLFARSLVYPTMDAPCDSYPETGSDSQKLASQCTTLRPLLPVGASLGPVGTFKRGGRESALWSLCLTSLLVAGCPVDAQGISGHLRNRRSAWNTSGDVQWLFRCPTDTIFFALELAAEL